MTYEQAVAALTSGQHFGAALDAQRVEEVPQQRKSPVRLLLAVTVLTIVLGVTPSYLSWRAQPTGEHATGAAAAATREVGTGALLAGAARDISSNATASAGTASGSALSAQVSEPAAAVSPAAASVLPAQEAGRPLTDASVSSVATPVGIGSHSSEVLLAAAPAAFDAGADAIQVALLARPMDLGAMSAAMFDALPEGVYPPAVVRWLHLVAAHWPAHEVANALCVVAGESGGDPTAHNTAPTEAEGGSVGLFQIAAGNLAGRNRIAGLESEPARTERQSQKVLLDPAENVRIAAMMWHAEGWLPAWLAQKERCGLTA